jgi:ribonuclease J
LFSSRVIPGNEKAIFRMQNKLAALGTEIVTDRNHHIHVSGHPAREEVRRLYQLVRPHMVVPVHGETRHLLEHAAFAKECGIDHSIVIEDGQMIRLSKECTEVVDNVTTGRLGLDGKNGGGYRLLHLDGEQLKVRRRMVFNGAAVVTVVMDRAGKMLADPVLSAPGLVDADIDQDLLDDLIDDIREAVMDLPATVRRDDVVVHETIRVATRRGLVAITGHKPVTDVHLVRV